MSVIYFLRSNSKNSYLMTMMVGSPLLRLPKNFKGYLAYSSVLATASLASTTARSAALKADLAARKALLISAT